MPISPATYTVYQGQTWDQVAFDLWGREGMTHHLLAANPTYRHLVFFPAGLVLAVPAVEVPPIEEPPPWQER